MAMWSRLKSIMGGDRTDYSIAAATTVNVPDSTNFVSLTGTATITTLNGDLTTRNRLVHFYQSDSGATTFTNTDSTTTAGQMDLGGSNITLGQTDFLTLWLRDDGVWVRVSTSNN